MKKLLIVLSLMFVGMVYADTETITWYVDGDAYTTTTCETGGDITLQTAPAKRGYTFTGWQVPLYDFSTLDPSIAGTDFAYNASNWTNSFPYGTLFGVSVCSITPGTQDVAGMPDEVTSGDNTVYCWCKATGYMPSGSNIVYENTSASSWVFLASYSSAASCSHASGCVSDCSFRVRNNASFRQALFGVTQ